MTPEQIEKLRELLETDVPLERIAADLGMSYHSLRVRLAQAGYAVRRRLVHLETERQRIVRSGPAPGTTVRVIPTDDPAPYRCVEGDPERSICDGAPACPGTTAMPQSVVAGR